MKLPLWDPQCVPHMIKTGKNGVVKVTYFEDRVHPEVTVEGTKIPNTLAAAFDKWQHARKSIH